MLTFRQSKRLSAVKHVSPACLQSKDNKQVKFGAKVNSIQTDEISFIEHHSFEAFHKGMGLKSVLNSGAQLTQRDNATHFLPWQTAVRQVSQRLPWKKMSCSDENGNRESLFYFQFTRKINTVPLYGTHVPFLD